MNCSNLNSIQQQANDWLVKLETGAMEPGDEDRFVVWLENDESHSQAFYEAEQIWQTMHQVSPAKLTISDSVSEKASAKTPKNPVVALSQDAVNSKDAVYSKDVVRPLRTHHQEPISGKTISGKTTPTQPAPSPIEKFVRVLLPLAATFILTFFAIFWGQDAWYSATADLYSAAGERQIQQLSDGSVITLNTHTAINLHYTDGQRLVELVMGEIYVEVYPDGQRPFVVQAGELQVTALGTEFIVRKEADKNPVVSVTEHSVKVESLDKADTQLVLDEGQQVSLIEEYDRLTNVEKINIKQVQTWKAGKFVFNNEPLKKVVEELNRYTSKKIVIQGSKNEQLRVTGVLNLDNPIASLQALAQQLGLKVNNVTPFLIYIESSY